MSETLQHLALLQASDGIRVTVTRDPRNSESLDNVRSCSLVAVPSRSTAKLVGDDGSFSVINVEDWLIVCRDWLIEGPSYPIKGDAISIQGSDIQWFVAHPDEKTAIFENFNLLDRPAKAWTVHSIPRQVTSF